MWERLVLPLLFTRGTKFGFFNGWIVQFAEPGGEYGKSLYRWNFSPTNMTGISVLTGDHSGVLCSPLLGFSPAFLSAATSGCSTIFEPCGNHTKIPVPFIHSKLSSPYSCTPAALSASSISPANNLHSRQSFSGKTPTSVTFPRNSWIASNCCFVHERAASWDSRSIILLRSANSFIENEQTNRADGLDGHASNH
jgi:hypothetical protein